MRAALPRSRPARRLAAVIAAAAVAAGALLALLHAPQAGTGRPVLAAASTAASGGHCTGTTLAGFPAVSGIAGGRLWYRAEPGGACVGTIVISVRYAGRGADPWQLIAYDDRDPGGRVIFTETAPAPAPGTYRFTVGVHRVFAGLTAVCAGAVSCITFSASY